MIETTGSPSWQVMREDLSGVAADWRQLGPVVPEASREAGRAWLASLSKRLNTPAAPRWRAAQVAELHMMRAHVQQGRAAAGLVEGDAAALLTARKTFAEALIDAVAHDGPPTRSWPATLNRWKDHDPSALTAALNALDAARHLPLERHRDSAAIACAMLADFAHDAERSARRPDMPPGSLRTPLDLLVHLAALIERARRAQPADKALAALSQRAEGLFLSRRMWRDGVKRLLNDALKRMVTMRPVLAAERRVLASTINEATRLLENRSVWVGDAVFERGQLHDNPHGRVFDSLLAHALIRRPPEPVMAAVATLCAGFRRELLADPLAGTACQEMCEDWRRAPRAWMPAAPGVPQLFDSQDDGGAAALRRVLAYLDRPMDRGTDRGLEVVARVYLLVYLAVTRGRVATRLEAPGARPDYMCDSGARVVALMDPLRPREPGSGPQGKGRAIGITLAHQPPAAEDVRYRAVERAAWGCRPGLPLEDGGRKFSPVIDAQHLHGQPFVSGLSGCTSVLLHLFAHLRDEALLTRAVDAADVLLAAAMTLIHDGGHSLFEVFKVGEMLRDPLALELRLPRMDLREQPEGCVSDLARLSAMFRSGTDVAVRAAITTAWQGTLDYFEKHHPRGSNALPRPGIKPPTSAG